MEKSSDWKHPIQMQSGALYTKLGASVQAEDRRNQDDYIRSGGIFVESEIRFWENLSFLVETGYRRRERTDTGRIQGMDRVGLGIKSAWEWESAYFGMGILGYSRDTSSPKTEENNPQLYLLRPFVSAGYRFQEFQIQGQLSFQSETNSRFRESFSEEFRRYYQVNLTASHDLGLGFDAFLEWEARLPYDREIDRESRNLAVFPGLAWTANSAGRFAISAGFPLWKDRIFDRSLQLQYLYLW
jgi:hypothetical protein